MKDLEKALQQFLEISRKESLPPTEVDAARTTAQGDNDDCARHSDTSLASEEMFALSGESDTGDNNPIQRALERVHEIITCLFRFSIVFRDSGRTDTRSKGPEVDDFVPYAIKHVCTRFPTAPRFLVERLGRLIAMYRQYFRHRETHREMPLQEAAEDQSEDAGQLSTLATPLPGVKSASRPRLLHRGTSTRLPAAYSDSGIGFKIRAPPSWPLDAQGGDTFECPICFRVVQAGSSKSWKHHVFEDIPP